MPRDPNTKSPTGQQPEALRSLKAAARAGSEKPEAQGMTAGPETAPEPDSLEQEQRAAARILKDGAEKQNPDGRGSTPPAKP